MKANQSIVYLITDKADGHLVDAVRSLKEVVEIKWRYRRPCVVREIPTNYAEHLEFIKLAEVNKAVRELMAERRRLLVQQVMAKVNETIRSGKGSHRSKSTHTHG